MSRSPSTDAHRKEAKASAGFALLTVSDTRTDSTDTSGARMRELILAAGHWVHAVAIVPDEPAQVRDRIATWAAEAGCEVIVASGGTGLSARDRTVEAVDALFTTRIEGFGELFRMLSYAEVGSAAILSRATAGVIGGLPVFLLPGSTNAVELALSRIVLPEIGHVLFELRRHGPRSARSADAF